MIRADTFVLRTQFQAPVAVREAFEVFEDPRNLALVTPPWLRFRLLTPEPVVMKANAEFDYSIRWLGLPLRWRSRITEYEPPFLFADTQIAGPYDLWVHRHLFSPRETGAIVTDEVTFRPPAGWLGTLAVRSLIGRQLKAIFRFRQEQLNEMMCRGNGVWTDPSITAIQP